MKTTLAFASCIALAGCAAAPEDRPMNADKETAAMMERAEEVARFHEAELARLTEFSRNFEAVAEELVRTTSSRLEAVMDGSAAREDGRNMIRAAFRDTLREMRNDPQRDPMFREAAAELERQMADALKPVDP